MPTRRTRIAHARVVAGPLELEHLELGDHLLGAGPGMACAICRSGIEIARPLWQANRAAILARWRHPFPTYAQVIFDRVPLPTAEPAHVGDSIIAAMIRDRSRAPLMPTNRKRIPHSRLAPPIAPEHWALLTDAPYPKDGNPWARHSFMPRAPVLWAEHRERILAAWIARRPGTRPALWWRFDAPEPRREVGADAVESEAAYLSRLGLLWPHELRRLQPEDMKPAPRDDA